MQNQRERLLKLSMLDKNPQATLLLQVLEAIEEIKDFKGFILGTKLPDELKGYSPVKGKDYFTSEEIASFVKEITDNIRIPDDGKTPVKGEDYFTEEEIKGVIMRVITSLPKQEKLDTVKLTNDILAKVLATQHECTPKEIADKLNTLEGAIDAKTIKGLVTIGDVEKSVKQQYNKNDMRWHGGGLSVVSHDATLTGSGTPSSPLSVVGGSGTGDVVGPAVAVDSNFAAFDTTTGKLIKDSGKKASDFATTAALSGYVPTTRTVNGKALSSDIVLTAADVGAGVGTWTDSSTNTGTNKTLNDNTNYIDSDALHLKVFLNLGGASTIGMPVYSMTWNVANSAPEVAKARANSTGTMPCIGLMETAGADGTVGSVRVAGLLQNVDTSVWSEGAALYVSQTTAGTLTATRPTGATELVQRIGTVIRQHATLGIIEVMGAGRTNDVPNTIPVPAFTSGSIIYADGTNLAQDNAALFYDATNKYVKVGGGTPTITLDSDHTFSGVKASAGYVSFDVQNTTAGTSASSDFIATSDTGTDTTNYFDIGINNSTYSDAAYNIGGALSGYMYTNGGDLTVGTQTATKVVKVHTGGTTSAQLRLTIDDSNATFVGNIIAPNVIPGFRTQATAAGTTTLTVTDAEQQEFTGATTQTVVLPTTSVRAGHNVCIINSSSGAVTVQSSGLNTIVVLAGGYTAYLQSKVATPTTAANWSFNVSPIAAATTAILVGGGTTNSPVWTTATGSGAPVRGTTPTIATPVINGLPTGTGVASAATVSTLASRDANGNLTAVNHIEGYATTATAAGTTTLTVSSAYQQYFTGATTQAVTMPASVPVGQSWLITNLSTGAVTVNATAGANTIVILAGGTSASFTSNTNTASPTAASWNLWYAGDAFASGKKFTVNNSITVVGTDGTTMTFPSTSSTVMTLASADTVAGVKTFNDGSVKLTGATSGASTLKAPAIASTYVHTLPAMTTTIASVGSSTEASNATTVVAITGIKHTHTITALAAADTFGVPTVATGALDDTCELIIRIKDNGTARALAFNAIFRASSDLALPTTTILSKTLYLGFKYNVADTKWDLIALLNNF